MDGEELDLTIIEATDAYSHPTKTALDTPTSNGTQTVPAVEDAERSSLEARIVHLEAEIENWQRRTVIWRERALSTQALNEALNKNLDDLRTVVGALAAAAPQALEANAPDVAASPQLARQPATAAVVEWCNKVFRRDFWTAPR